MIQAIGFDYSGVIEIPEFNPIDRIVSLLSITKDEWKLEYTKSAQQTLPETEWSQIVLHTVIRLNSDAVSAAEKILIESESTKLLNKELIELIAKLKNQGYKIALISNHTASLRNRLKEQDILSFFDIIAISGELGFRKPEVSIFEFVLNELEIKGSEFLFIDDSKDSFVNSESIEYVPVLYTNITSLSEELSSRGIKF